MLTDISYPYQESMAIYPGNPGFSFKQVQDLDNGDNVNISTIFMGSHTGTHIDSPSHFISNGKTIDQISLEAMNGVAKLFDLRGNDDITKDLLVQRDINAEDIIIFKTNNSDVFHADTILTDYVTLDYEAAEYLVNKKIKMVCIDYMTIERPRRKRISGKSVHYILLSNEVLIAETLNLKEVGEGSYQLHCFPINIVGSDGVPVRIAVSER